MEKILGINAHIKYVEYLLHVFDTYPEETSLKTIREEFKNIFNTQHVLLNQNFGIYRLLPIILIKEEYKKDRKDLEGTVNKIKIIRDSVVHNNFEIDEYGYLFKNKKENIYMLYDEFVSFVHEVENEFYKVKI